MAAGAPIPVGTGSPVPTQTTVPTYNGDANAAVFGGVFSTYNLANFEYNGLCQTVTVPASVTFTMSIFGNGNEGATYVDFVVDLLDGNGNFLANLYTENVENDTTFRTITIPSSTYSAYVGQTVELFVGMWTKSGSGSNSTKYSGYYFVDNVSLFGIPQTPAAIHRRPAVKVIRH